MHMVVMAMVSVVRTDGCSRTRSAEGERNETKRETGVNERTPDGSARTH
jgi:hypothetical protein